MSRPLVKASLLDALIPVILLIAMLAGTVYVFGLDSSGPNQVFDARQAFDGARAVQC